MNGIRWKIAIILLLGMGCRCDECFLEYPYLNFAMEPADTLNHPISKNSLVRIYSYYKGSTNWDRSYIFDSTRTYNLNWSKVFLNSTGDTFRYYFPVDHTISPSTQLVDFEKYDYRLVSVQGDLEIKISNLKVKTIPPKGRCDCEKSHFESCTVNDSITDYNRTVLVF